MATTARLHVEHIRRRKFSIGQNQPNPLTEDLHHAVTSLSAELYTKDVHFLMELIQVLFLSIFLCFCLCLCIYIYIQIYKSDYFSVGGWVECRRQRVLSGCKTDTGVCADGHGHNRVWCSCNPVGVQQ